MLRPGSSFPVKIPQAKDQSFTLNVTDIGRDGYTLQLGEATKRMRYELNASSGVKFSN